MANMGDELKGSLAIQPLDSPKKTWTDTHLNLRCKNGEVIMMGPVLGKSRVMSREQLVVFALYREHLVEVAP